MLPDGSGTIKTVHNYHVIAPSSSLKDEGSHRFSAKTFNNDDDEYDYALDYWIPSSVENELLSQLKILNIPFVKSEDLA